MNMHPIIHTGLARERERDLEQAMRARRLAMLARADDQDTLHGLAVSHAVPCDDAAPDPLAALEAVNPRVVPC